MKIHRFWAFGLLTALLWTAAIPGSAAQESPPARVGRLSYIGGSVSFEPAGTEQWAPAELNQPVTIGDRLWTDWDSRAEIELGTAVVRLGSRSGFSFLNLTASTAQMQLTAGTLIVHVFSLANGAQDEVDTPNLAVSLEQPGIYRVQVNSSGTKSEVEVIEGEALASGAGQTFSVAAQQRATFTGGNTLRVAYGSVGEPDAFDEWSMARDRRQAEGAAAVTRYVAADTVGSNDLNTYGSWQATPQWGEAWFPNVVAGWAPYRFGQWIWIFPWGWTWVDDEPWGFAPFHYGRWGYWHHAWCWVPGPRDVRPIYAPALVAWTHGGQFGREHRDGHVGWVPLGPRDVYLPGYAASRTYVRNVNLTNARNLSPAFVAAAYRHGGAGLSFANGRVPGAITAVPRAVFSAAQAADTHRVVLMRHGLLGVRLTPAAPAVTPSRASVFGARVHALQVPPRQLIDRPVVARLVPARAAVTFARQQAAVRANNGRLLTMSQWAPLRPNAPPATVRLAPDIRPAAPLVRNGRLRGDFTSRTPTRDAIARPAPAAQRTGSDRPAWAQPPSSVRRPQPVWVPQSFSGQVSPGERFARPQPLPQRHVPRPQYHPPRAAQWQRAAPSARPPMNAPPRARPAPPMYRPQDISAEPDWTRARSVPKYYYVPPRSPPPMYRPLSSPVTPNAVASPPRAPIYRPMSTPARPMWRPHPPHLP